MLPISPLNLRSPGLDDGAPDGAAEVALAPGVEEALGRVAEPAGEVVVPEELHPVTLRAVVTATPAEDDGDGEAGQRGPRQRVHAVHPRPSCNPPAASRQGIPAAGGPDRPGARLSATPP